MRFKLCSPNPTYSKCSNSKAEKNSLNKSSQRPELGQKIISSIDFDKYETIQVIESLTSMLGFIVMISATSEEGRKKVIAGICLSLIKNSSVLKSDIEKIYFEYEKAGLINKGASEQ